MLVGSFHYKLKIGFLVPSRRSLHSRQVVKQFGCLTFRAVRAAEFVAADWSKILLAFVIFEEKVTLTRR